MEKKLNLKNILILSNVILISLIIINVIDYFMDYDFSCVKIIEIILVVIIFRFFRIKGKEVMIKETIADSVVHLSQYISSVKNKEELYQVILEKTVDVVKGGQKGSLMILEGNSRLSYKAVVGFNLKELKKVNLKLEDTFLYVKSKGNIRKSVVINNVAEFNKRKLDNRSYQKLEETGMGNIRCTISTPIFVDGKLFGMINIDSTKDIDFDSMEVELVEYFSLEISKIIKIHHMFERTINLAKYDYMTNTCNRCFFESSMNDVIKKAERKNFEFTIIYVDLDNLKTINDKYGHDLGDRLIKYFVLCMTNFLNEDEKIARYGGDEFVIYLNRNETAAKDYVRQCKEEFLNNPIEYSDEKIYVEFSFGISKYPRDSREFEELLCIADEKMYINKTTRKKGR